MLVSFGAALFVLVPQQMATDAANSDAVSRVIQGIAAGVGFLGAGEILREAQHDMQLAQIHGLTSAAAIWVSAALGIAAGCGLWYTALIAAVMSFIVLRTFKKLEKRKS